MSQIDRKLQYKISVMKKPKQRVISTVVMILLVAIFVIGQQQRSDQPIDAQFSQNNQSQTNRRLSRSQQIKIEQKERFKKVQERVDSDTKFTNLLFTVYGVEQFLLNLPVAQQVAINLFTYQMINNAYMRPQNIQNQPPIKIFIFQNNNRLIHQSSFYFQNYLLFDGQQLSTYTIRFINPGSEKLITMTLKKLTETAHVEKVLEKTEVLEHATKASMLFDQIKFFTNAFERYTMINFQAVKAILHNINLYFYWSAFQTILTIIVCFVQVTFIRRICKAESIV